MPQVKTEPYLRLELTVDKRILSDYKLEDILYNSYKVKHPCESVGIDAYESNQITFPFTFPPSFTKHSKKYLEKFVLLYSELVSEIDKKHHDNILFLAYSYFIESEKNNSNTTKHNFLRERGQLLLEFIKIPIPTLNSATISDVFEEEDLHYSNIREYILLYLGIASGKSDENFLIEPSNPKSEVDFNKIDKELWIELSRRIQMQKNISIVIDKRKSKNGTFEKRYLTVSKDIGLNFQHVVDGAVRDSFKVGANYQNADLLKLLVRQLFAEQKKHKTDLYYAILNHDFIVDTNYRDLISAAGRYNRFGSHSISLKKLYDTLIQYFNSNSLLCQNTSILQNRKRNNFLYQYFLLVDLRYAPVKAELTAESSVNEDSNLSDLISQFKEAYKLNPNYANTTINNMFRNNRRQDKYSNIEKGQSLQYY